MIIDKYRRFIKQLQDRTQCKEHECPHQQQVGVDGRVKLSLSPYCSFSNKVYTVYWGRTTMSSNCALNFDPIAHTSIAVRWPHPCVLHAMYWDILMRCEMRWIPLKENFLLLKARHNTTLPRRTGGSITQVPGWTFCPSMTPQVSAVVI